MNSTHRIAHRFLAVAAVALSTAAPAMDSGSEAIAALSSSELRAAYLHCDRVTSESEVEPAFMMDCARVADVLLQRDFAGNLELQLQWWREARRGSMAGGNPAVTQAADLE